MSSNLEALAVQVFIGFTLGSILFLTVIGSIALIQLTIKGIKKMRTPIPSPDDPESFAAYRSARRADLFYYGSTMFVALGVAVLMIRLITGR